MSGLCMGSTKFSRISQVRSLGSVESVSWARLSRSARSDRVESVSRSGEVNRSVQVMLVGSDSSGRVNRFGRSVGSFGWVGSERTISSVGSRCSGRAGRVGPDRAFRLDRFVRVSSSDHSV